MHQRHLVKQVDIGSAKCYVIGELFNVIEKVLRIFKALEFSLRYGLPFATAKLNLCRDFDDIFYRYNSSTGTFTVPPCGDGLYYFSVYLVTPGDEYAYFDLEINGQPICSAMVDLTDSASGDEGEASCHGAAEIAEGKHLFKHGSLFCPDI